MKTLQPKPPTVKFAPNSTQLLAACGKISLVSSTISFAIVACRTVLCLCKWENEEAELVLRTPATIGLVAPLSESVE